jgi:large subunit ribosomal protein L30
MTAKEKNTNNTNKETVKVKLVRGINKKLKAHQACIKGLGLRAIGQVVEVENTAATRGMINKVGYLLEVEEK